jgi:hypothetical protein
MSPPSLVSEPRSARRLLRKGTWQRLAQLTNTWPDKPSPSGKLDAVLLIAVPLLTFGLVLLFAGVAGVAYHPGCNSTSGFFNNLLFQPGKPSTCRSVAFLSDIPMVILSITCPLAAVTFYRVRRRLAGLYPSLTAVGLVDDVYMGRKAPQIKRLEGWVDLGPKRRLALFAGTTVAVTWLYVRTLDHSHLFTILARNGVSTVPELRDRWWANYHHHPGLAILCVVVGSVGVYYALRLAIVYFGVGLIFGRQAGETDFEYVPRWQDKTYGWSVITGTLFLVYISMISLAVSVVAVYNMLEEAEWTRIVAFCFAGLGIVANLTIFGGSLYLVLRAHDKVEKRLRGDLRELNGAAANPGNISAAKSYPRLETDFQRVAAASDLASWRKIPVASFSGAALKIVPGVYAVIQLIVQLVTRGWFIKH